MSVHEFDTYEEAKEFAHNTQGDKTLERVDGKFKITVRELSAIHRVAMEGPDPVEEQKDEEEEEEERSDQES